MIGSRCWWFASSLKLVSRFDSPTDDEIEPRQEICVIMLDEDAVLPSTNSTGMVPSNLIFGNTHFDCWDNLSHLHLADCFSGRCNFGGTLGTLLSLTFTFLYSALTFGVGNFADDIVSIWTTRDFGRLLLRGLSYFFLLTTTNKTIFLTTMNRRDEAAHVTVRDQ